MATVMHLSARNINTAKELLDCTSLDVSELLDCSEADAAKIILCVCGQLRWELCQQAAEAHKQPLTRLDTHLRLPCHVYRAGVWRRRSVLSPTRAHSCGHARGATLCSPPA